MLDNPTRYDTYLRNLLNHWVISLLLEVLHNLLGNGLDDLKALEWPRGEATVDQGQVVVVNKIVRILLSTHILGLIHVAEHSVYPVQEPI